MATSRKQISGSLITRNYRNFSGVDFTNRGDEISLNHSPDALNMWKDYTSSTGKCVETRPDLEEIKEYQDKIYGLFFYTVNNTKKMVVHSGKNLYYGNDLIYSDMNEEKSIYFVFDGKLYIIDGNSYLVYDGITVDEVAGYIPTTSISRNPAGGGKIHEDINLLSDYRKNTFCSDGESLEYFTDVETFDDNDVRVWVLDGAEWTEQTTGFTADKTAGKVIFTTAPDEPLTDGEDNVMIQFKKEVNGYRDRIEKCTLVELFDNRVFFSGNKDYANVLFHSSLNDPTYVSDYDYYEEGVNDSEIKAIVSGNNALWVMKEPSQNNTNIFYHNPTIDSEYGKIYPSTHSSISTGCIGAGINFNDRICFYSPNGLEKISGDVTTEQVITHASSLVDGKLLNETEYKDMILVEWKGYLLTIIGNHIYLADYRNYSEVNNHYEYEWFYWQFDEKFINAIVEDEKLYLCTDKTIYTLTKKDNDVYSYWTTIEDEFDYPEYQKTTNKKGCVVDMKGDNLTVYTKTDNKDFTLIKKYTNTKGYIVPRIKKKKWKSIQIKFSSDKPFGIYSLTLEAYVGSYVKR